MGKGEKVIVYYGMPSWDGLHTRQNQFAKFYQEIGHKVFYVEKPESIFKTKRFHGFKRNVNGISILSSRGTLLPQSTIFGRLELKLLLFLKLVGILSIEKSIYRLYVRLPHTIFTFLIKYYKVVYDIVDDYSVYAKRPSQRKHVIYKHKLLAELAFKVIATNELLLENVPTKKRAVVVPNGVHIENFDFVLDRNSKGILFLGLLSNWLNWGLIQKMIEEYGSNFMIVGPVSDDLKSIYKDVLKGANWLGVVAQDSLEEIVGSTKVCVMPYAWEDIGSARTPLKLYEYLATGRDIVCIPYPNYIRDTSLSGLIHFVSTDEEFLEKIRFSLNESIRDSIFSKRKTVALRMNWRGLFEKMVTFVND